MILQRFCVGGYAKKFIKSYSFSALFSDLSFPKHTGHWKSLKHLSSKQFNI